MYYRPLSFLPVHLPDVMRLLIQRLIVCICCIKYSVIILLNCNTALTGRVANKEIKYISVFNAGSIFLPSSTNQSFVVCLFTMKLFLKIAIQYARVYINRNNINRSIIINYHKFFCSVYINENYAGAVIIKLQIFFRKNSFAL